MLSKDLIKGIIIENQRFISSVSFFERDYAFEDALNYVLVGLRRAGKSYLLPEHYPSTGMYLQGVTKLILE